MYRYTPITLWNSLPATVVEASFFASSRRGYPPNHYVGIYVVKQVSALVKTELKIVAGDMDLQKFQGVLRTSSG